MPVNSIDAETTEQCIREFQDRLDARIEREQALYDAEARGDVAEWEPEPSKHCPVCQVALTESGMTDAWETLKLGDVPAWIEQQHVFTCSEVHDRLWRKMKEYRGVLDYRRCHFCARTFQGNVAKVSIYTFPPMPKPVTTEPGNFSKSGLCVDDADDEYAHVRIHTLNWGLHWGPGMTLETPAKEWRAVDLCSAPCLDQYIYHLPEPLDFSDVVYVKKPASALVTTGTRNVDRTADLILTALAQIQQGLAVSDIVRETNLPRTTVQTALERLKKDGKVQGGGKRVPWLRVVGE